MQTKKNFYALTFGTILIFSTIGCSQEPNPQKEKSSEESKISDRETQGGFIFPYYVPHSNPKDSIRVDTNDVRLIRKTLVDSCVGEYITHGNKLPISTPEHPNGETLRGYVITVPRIKDLLDANPQEIHLQFGVRPELVDSPDNKQSFTLIISGYDKNRNIIKKDGKELFYEYIRPCPPNSNCPR